MLPRLRGGLDFEVRFYAFSWIVSHLVCSWWVVEIAMTLFNHLMLMTSSYADVSRLDYPSERDTIEQLLELPLERHEVSFLVSDEALDRCSIRGKLSVFDLPVFLP